MMSKILKDLEFTFTGKRYGTDGNDDIDAIGFGGIIYAGKGHDTITVLINNLKISTSPSDKIVPVSGVSGNCKCSDFSGLISHKF